MTQKLTTKPIAIASDHRGFALKAHLNNWLSTHGYAVKDCGTQSATERVDAMDYGVALATEIARGNSDFAIAICGSGQMMAMTTNRFPFIRATLLHTEAESILAREHADANVLIFGADIIDHGAAEQILARFLATPALGERYAERRERLARLNVSKP